MFVWLVDGEVDRGRLVVGQLDELLRVVECLLDQPGGHRHRVGAEVEQVEVDAFGLESRATVTIELDRPVPAARLQAADDRNEVAAELARGPEQDRDVGREVSREDDRPREVRLAVGVRLAEHLAQFVRVRQPLEAFEAVRQVVDADGHDVQYIGARRGRELQRPGGHELAGLAVVSLQMQASGVREVEQANASAGQGADRHERWEAGWRPEVALVGVEVGGAVSAPGVIVVVRPDHTLG